jgi:flavodoxin
MADILIIYHSHTGNTEVMARIIAESAINTGARVTVKKVADAAPGDLLKYDIVVFGSPNEFGRMCGLLQDFLERTWLTVADNTANIKYAAFTSGGSSQRTALESIEGALAGFNRNKLMKFSRIADGVVGIRAQTDETLRACREFGRTIAALK